ncbi:MAG: iron ABC transporter permease [Thermoanaerobacteraceae bacterium]|nr:iron ABC transporter permease [Thermoanaerobacteraceae bacterium]
MKKIIIFCCLVIFLSLFLGRLWFSPFSSLNGFSKIILFDVRFPRIIAVSLAGASLGLAGVAFQSLFRNYLAGPDILGVTTGSAFGAVLAILFFPFNPYIIQGSSFIFGIIAVILVYKLGSLIGKSLLSLILAGMVVSAIFAGFVGLFKYIADPYNKLPTIVFWLLGSFSGVRWKDLSIAAFPMIIGIVGLLSMGWIFNILSLGDEEAKALGVNVNRWKITAIILATLSSSATTALAGMIAWIGVVSPHIARLIVGVNNKKLVPASAVVGAVLLLICDDLARCLVASELPLSIMTDFIGAPILFFILVKRRKMYYVKD